MTPLPEQEAIAEAVASGGSAPSVMVEAGAGCAKTTTMVLAAQRVRQGALAVAFNKRIAEELASRLPPNFLCKTMNGLGHQAWGRVLGIRLQLDDRKVGRICSAVAKDRKVQLDTDQWGQLRELVTEAQIQGLVPTSRAKRHPGFVEDTRAGWSDLADRRGILPDDAEFLWELAREALERVIDEGAAGKISFNDQIYLPVLFGAPWPRFSQVMVDEDQDLNPLNIEMLGLLCADAGRITAVGDMRQAIYAFRGACGDSAARIRALRGAWTDLPLMTTFRCPKEVVRRQQAHVPLFRAFDSNPDGLIADWSRREATWNWEALAQLHPADAPIAVLCRNNAPLLSLAFRLLRQGIGCHMLGRDIGKNLIDLSKKICPEDGTPAPQCAALIAAWQEREEALLRANDKAHLVAGVSDRAESLQAVLASTGCRDAGQLRSLLESLFARTEGLVTLSSIHKAKGLEWPKVLHLDPWRIPSKWARAAAESGDRRQLEQELNLRYVAETRTKHTLILANLDGWGGTA